MDVHEITPSRETSVSMNPVYSSLGKGGVVTQFEDGDFCLLESGTLLYSIKYQKEQFYYIY
jgi:hypothetical protein